MYLKKLFTTKFAMFIVALFICATTFTNVANAQTYPALPTWGYGPYMVINNWILQENTTGTTWVTRALVQNNSAHQGANRISPAYSINPGKTYRIGFSGLGWYGSTTYSYQMYTCVWFDFGADGTFSNVAYPSGDRLQYSYPTAYYGNYANIGTTTCPWTNFTVPSNIVGRTVRLRIAGAYSGISVPPVPTGTIASQYGDCIDIALYVAPPPNDAGITSIDLPGLRFMQGNQNVTVKLKNYSAAPMTSCVINFTVDGVQRITYPWTGNMAKDSVAAITIGSYNFNEYKTYAIRAFTTLPNGATDVTPSNDFTNKSINPAPDAGIASFTQPSGAFPKGTQTIAVNLTNYGWYPLSKVDIIWSAGVGYPAYTYNWTGNLASGETEEVIVGTFDFNQYKVFDFTAYTDRPDTTLDEMTANDGTANGFAPALEPANYYIGAYGGSSNTFSDITVASEYITAAGILGDGTMNLIFPDLDLGDPNYTGSLNIGTFPVSGSCSVVIRSESNDPDNVRLEFEPDGATPYLATLNGINSVTVQGIHFIVTDTYGYGGIFNIQNCNGVTFTGNEFENVAGASQGYDYTTINLDNTYDVHVMENSFLNGAIAINEQSYCPRKLNIHNNTFTDASWKFIQLYGIPDGNPCTENDVVIHDNQFVGNSYYAPFGISSVNGTEIMTNTFSGFEGFTANDAVIYLENTDPTNFTGQTEITGNSIFSNLTEINGIFANNLPNLSITDNRISVIERQSSGITTNAIYLNNSGDATTPVYVTDNEIAYANSENGNGIYITMGQVMILRNDIDLPTASSFLGAGISASQTSGYIANNQIGATLGSGVFLNNTDLYFYYNTVATQSANSPAIFLNGGTNTIMRNIFQNEGVGFAIVASNAGLNNIDQNNYFSAGDNMGQWSGVNQDSLELWQFASGKDVSSTEQQIAFLDFTTFNLGLNTFTEELVFDYPLTFGDPNIEAEVQGTDYNGKIRYSYFMGSENIIPEIFITTQPIGVMDCLGNTDHSLRVSAYVTRGVLARYEWYKDGVSLTTYYKDPINDNWADKASLYLDSISFNPTPGLHYEIEGTYRCLVRGSGAEPQWSDYVLVNVLSPAEITRQPEDQRANLNGEAVLEVEAHILADEGMDDAFYQPEVQWYRGSIANPIVSDYDADGHYYGAKSTILTIKNITSAEIGDDYFVVLRGSCDSLYSDMVSVKLYPSVTITEDPATQSVCEGSPVTFEVTASASDQEATVEYQWRKDGMAISGATMSSYMIDAVSATDVANYDCLVTVLPGGSTETSAVASLTMKLAPSISVQPTDITGAVGQPFTLFVTADGEQPLEYQWYKDGVIIDAATTNQYEVTVAALTDAGVYTCEVKNVCATIVTTPATVTISEGGIISVGDQENGGFVLGENTPNPFNEMTTIKFFAPYATTVRLAITDVYGKELSVPFEGAVAANQNEIKVNASELASGVYYYTLTSGNYTITRKMVVVK